MSFDHDCQCCYPTSLKSIYVPFECDDNTTMEELIKIPRHCECSKCGAKSGTKGGTKGGTKTRQ